MTMDAGIAANAGPFEALVAMHADLGARMDRVEKRLISPRPINRVVGGSVTMRAATDVVTVSERPARGRVWNIVKVVLTGIDGHTPTGVTADVYASTLIDPNTPDLSSLIQTNMAVPSVQYWPKDLEWCNGAESVFALLYNGTAGQLVNIAVRVRDFPVPVAEGMHA